MLGTNREQDVLNDNGAVIRKAIEWRGAPMALATVISTWGSAPRPRGSHMLVHQDGRLEGSISGGCVETDVLQRAAEVIAGRPAHVHRYGVADGDAWDVGLPCGGEIAVLVQPVSDAGFPPHLFDLVAKASAVGRAATLATDLATGQTREGDGQGAFLNRYDPPRRLLIVGADRPVAGSPGPGDRGCPGRDRSARALLDGGAVSGRGTGRSLAR